MATLPADRSKLALAQSNQVPSAVASSTRNINAMTEAYDTIDLLNNKVSGLVSGNFLSDLGIINAKNYSASGSTFSTTGSITQGTNRVLLASSGDFAVGQGLSVEGIHEIASLTVTNAATTSANCTVTLNGVAKTVALTNGDTTSGVATKIRASSFPGWTTGGSGDTITFTANASGTRTDATYSAGTTGATGTMTSTTQGTADLVGTITELVNNVATLTASAGTNLANRTVRHDDTSAIQLAINAATATGGSTIVIPSGTYNLTSRLSLGSNIEIVGNGYNSTVICFASFPAQDEFLMLATSQSNIIIRNIWFRGQKSGNGLPPPEESNYGVRFDTTNDAQILNCKFTQFSVTGISIRDFNDVHIRGCIFDDINTNGIAITRNGRNLWIDSNKFTNCFYQNINFEDSNFSRIQQDAWVSRNSISGPSNAAGWGISISTGDLAATGANKYFRIWLVENSITTVRIGITAKNFEDLYLIDNKIDDCFELGIRLAAGVGPALNAEVNGNQISNTATGIGTTNAIENAVIAHNHIYTISSRGIYGFFSKTQIVHNVFEACTTSGLRIDAATVGSLGMYNKIESNLFRNCGTTCVSIQGNGANLNMDIQNNKFVDEIAGTTNCVNFSATANNVLVENNIKIGITNFNNGSNIGTNATFTNTTAW